jgi:hypothetical protein
MTVAELIEKLKKFPPEMRVVEILEVRIEDRDINLGYLGSTEPYLHRVHHGDLIPPEDGGREEMVVI